MTKLHDRRSFLSSLGAITAGGFLQRTQTSSTFAAPPNTRTPAGLALSPDDFMLAPGLIYLQTGSLGPTPRPVMERTIAAWKELELDPSFYGYVRHEEAMEEVRAKTAKFIGCKTDEVVITRCTTEGMNWTAQGLALKPGDRVLTTDQEHPGGRVCWDYLERRQGVRLDVVEIPSRETDAKAIVDLFSKRITPQTRILSFSHLLTSTGLRMPVAELSNLARSNGCIAVVDGAQAIGSGPIDVKALGCQVYAASGHKWLLGPKGTGFLYLSEELGNRIEPIALQAGRKAYSDSSGVSSIPSVIGMGAAIDYLSRIGLDRIETHNLDLRNRLYAALKRVPRLQVVSAPPGPLASALLSYKLPDELKSRAFQQRMLEKHKIELKVVPKNWFNGNRVSTHLFNTEKDVDALVATLKAELG